MRSEKVFYSFEFYYYSSFSCELRLGTGWCGMSLRQRQHNTLFPERPLPLGAGAYPTFLRRMYLLGGCDDVVHVLQKVLDATRASLLGSWAGGGGGGGSQGRGHAVLPRLWLGGTKQENVKSSVLKVAICGIFHDGARQHFAK